MAELINSDSPRSRRKGRPTLLSEATAKVLFEAIERGLPYKQAAGLAGISYDTFNRWRIKGRTYEAPQEFCDFCDRLELAQAKAVDSLVETVRKAASKGDWKAAAWMLERRHPEEWERLGRTSNQESTLTLLDDTVFS